MERSERFSPNQIGKAGEGAVRAAPGPEGIGAILAHRDGVFILAAKLSINRDKRTFSPAGVEGAQLLEI